jgi:signal transduction histidine kinase/CheY-like chemotaxis protein
MRFFRRSLVALGVAAMLPTIVFAAVAVLYSLRAESRRIEAGTLGRSQIVMMLADATLQRDTAVLNVLSSSIYLENRDWAEFYPRVRRVLGINPQWSTIAIMDPVANQELFDLGRPFSEPIPIPQRHRAAVAGAVQSGKPQVGGVDTVSKTVWIYVPVLRDGHVAFVLAASIKPQAFQDLLLSVADKDSIAAIVDARGHFVARTMDYEHRLGTPATSFVRDAIGRDKRGFYRGTTYEGVQNFTAFYTSPFTGWSAHLTVASSLIDEPTTWSFIVAGLAGLGSLLLGAVLVTLVLRDMSERRRAEDALRQAQKMEAVGQLTGGIAHDFNNLLTAIIGNLDMIRTRVGGNERIERLSSNALEAARRGAKLAAQLLAFSRSQRMSVGTVDLQRLLNGMSGLLTQSVGPAIEVRVHVDPAARFVVSDANQLELALLNLSVNARDAMPGGGLLTIETRRATDVDRHLPRVDYVDMRVTDTGIGMSDDVRSRAVEPFFTTKPVGQGTGLGLSQVYGVVRESGGALSIESEVGRGTTVCLTLRRSTGTDAKTADAHAAAASGPPAQQPDGETRVLVVDDDKLVRRFMSESLRSLRYQVIEAENGSQALEILDTTRADLLLVDFAMPGMNGAEVARAAQDKQPGLQVLVVSGYADSAAVEAALGAARQLRKPFDLAELGAAVAEVLKSR